MNIHTIISKIVPFFRKKRMTRFVQKLNPTTETTILDVGGGAFNWDLIQSRSKITLLNLSKPAEMTPQHGTYEFVMGDGTDLNYKDKSFDIVYSNSVIEHLCTWEKQKQFALETRRVGKKIWLQTPARSFFVEPHYITPFIHYLPKSWQRKLLRDFSVWGLITRPDQQYVDSLVNEIRLLSFNEMKELFPDCIIEKERFLFFTKCFIAIKN